jgi:hypothetical protein
MAGRHFQPDWLLLRARSGFVEFFHFSLIKIITDFLDIPWEIPFHGLSETTPAFQKFAVPGEPNPIRVRLIR